MLSEYERQVLATMEAELTRASDVPRRKVTFVLRVVKTATAVVGIVIVAVLAASVTVGIITAVAAG